ncbi:MAG: HupE/UreJ family protein [Gemmatimonadales bacterium]
MSEVLAYFRFGVSHIASPGALDHLLFLVALVAPYRVRDWRQLLGVVTAFTVGHSLTLALVVTGAVTLPTALIEFLIPLTIVAAGVENIRGSARRGLGWARPLLAVSFGLVHGAGFANFLHSMFSGSIALPLLSFNLGIEAGQILVLTAALGLLSGLDRLASFLRVAPAPRVRAVTVSLLAMGWASVMAAQRAPW